MSHSVAIVKNNFRKDHRLPAGKTYKWDGGENDAEKDGALNPGMTPQWLRLFQSYVVNPDAGINYF